MRRVYLIIAASVLALDQITKWLVLIRLSPESIVAVIPGFFSLVRVENRGIAFGMLAGLSSNLAYGLIVLVSVAALVLVCYLLWNTGPSAKRAGVALALILGGAAGNLADRMIRGSVIDFLDFYVRSYHWFTFNIGDSAIVVGAGLLALDLFWGRHRLEKAEICAGSEFGDRNSGIAKRLRTSSDSRAANTGNSI